MLRSSRVLRRPTIDRGLSWPIRALLLAVFLGVAGCGGDDSGTGPTLGEDSGLSLPPGFKPVDLPVETRKEIFREAHRARALAVLEADRKLPMDEAHMPKGEGFAKRIAESKAITDGIAEQKLTALTERYKVSRADLGKIEEEATRLRWTPPEAPTLEEAEPKPAEEVPKAEEKKDVAK